MEFDIRGDADGGPSLRLDHEDFAYAGKFVMSNTGKAVAEEGGELVAAAAFNRDRTDPEVAWIRYVTVRSDRRGEGVGSNLLAFTVEHLRSDHDRVRIAVNNPFAYEAAYKAGFGYTGDRTGLAELVLERPDDRSQAAYRAGLDVYRTRDGLSADAAAFLGGRDGSVPPLIARER